METITFHETKNNITFTVKSDFATVCSDYKTTPAKELVEKHNIFKYFHNPNGPSVVDHKTNTINYFLNGHLVEGEELEKIKHREQFNGKMDKVLQDETAS